MPYSSLMRSSLYQTMYPSSMSMKLSIETPRNHVHGRTPARGGQRSPPRSRCPDCTSLRSSTRLGRTPRKCGSIRSSGGGIQRTWLRPPSYQSQFFVLANEKPRTGHGPCFFTPRWKSTKYATRPGAISQPGRICHT